MQGSIQQNVFLLENQKFHLIVILILLWRCNLFV